MEKPTEHTKNLLDEKADLEDAENLLRVTLRNHLSLEEILERVRRLREKSKENTRSPQSIAKEILEEHFRLLED